MDVPYDLNSYIRVLKLASTPSTDEFLQVSKIAGAGILLIGFIGFLMFAIMSLLPGSARNADLLGQDHREAGADRRRHARGKGDAGDSSRHRPRPADELRDGRGHRRERIRPNPRRDPHARGVIQGSEGPAESPFSEVEHFLSPTPDVEGIAEGDIVELIAGPFKGEKARVQRIDGERPGDCRAVRGDRSDSGDGPWRPDPRARLGRALSGRTAPISFDLPEDSSVTTRALSDAD